MLILKAALLGLIQGLTCFFPVSSSGHLILLGSLPFFQHSINYSVIVFLDLGMVVGIYCAFKKDIKRLIRCFFRLFRDLLYNLHQWWKHVKDPDNAKYLKVLSDSYTKFAALLFLSCIPSFLISLFLHSAAGSLVNNLLMTGVGFFLTALFLVIAGFTPSRNRGPKDCKGYEAVLIGAAQGFSVLPGISRLGITAAVGCMDGLTRKFVIKYIYILLGFMSLGDLIIELGAMPSSLTDMNWISCITGMVVSAGIGYFIIRHARRLITKKNLKFFALYNIMMGVISIILYLI